ncbi:MAG: hypothetical protein ABI818_20530 [Acidobacteriota bacterium]
MTELLINQTKMSDFLEGLFHSISSVADIVVAIVDDRADGPGAGVALVQHSCTFDRTASISG